MSQTQNTITLAKQLVVAEPLAERSGYSYTLASWLSDMLVMVEARFGCRDQSYTILGIEFAADGPRIWFPGGRKHVVIQLQLVNAGSMIMALWQLAHECVHLISPNLSVATTVLEEGLCVVFQEQYVATRLGISIATQMSSYREAATLVSELLAFDSGAILALRQEQPTISSISSQLIQKHCPGIRIELADRLVAPFQK